MSTPKSAKRNPWLWIGLCLALAAGVSIAGAARKASSRGSEVRRAPAAPAASAGSGGAASAPSNAEADRDVCAQQLD
jgi:hypothetical protein